MSRRIFFNKKSPPGTASCSPHWQKEGQILNAPKYIEEAHRTADFVCKQPTNSPRKLAELLTNPGAATGQ